MTIETRLFINNEFVEGTQHKTFDLVNPYTEEKLASVHEATAEDVDLAVEAAHKAFPSWSSKSAIDRQNILIKFADLLERDADEIAELESKSMGIPKNKYAEFVRGSAAGIRSTSGLIHDIHGETSLHTPGFLNISFLQPLGVCAGILPWNVPVVMFCGKVVPCVLAGNTIVIKSSEKAPLTALKFAQLIKEAGFPAGVVNVLSGLGRECGSPLTTHPLVKKVSFTGSTQTGEIIYSLAAKSMKSVCLETGGKNAAVVFDDADLDKAAKDISDSKLDNSGQICVSNSRVYVHEKVFDEFLTKFTKHFHNVKFGDPLDESTNFGPLVDKIQYDSVKAAIKQATDEGLTVHSETTAVPSKGYFVGPVVFVNPPEQSKVMTEEIFGPVIALQKFTDEDQVVHAANDTKYGLHAAVYTRDISRAIRVAKAFDNGMVTVNCSSTSGPYDLPFGANKESGHGRENGKTGLLQYFESKSITIAL